MWNVIKLILIGLVGGVIGGMGMGGGTLLIPLLVFFAKTPQHTAQAVNLLTFVPTAAVALIFHIKNKLVKFKGVLWIIIPAVISAVGASFLARATDRELLSRLFGGFLGILGIFILIQEIFSKKKS